MPAQVEPLSDGDYTRLLEFRTQLRRFMRRAENNAAYAGITPAQHQLLLAVKGHPGGRPSIGEVAGYLLEKQHSVSELADRAQKEGLVRRIHDVDDRRVVRLAITPKGQRKLARLSEMHMDEIARLAPVLTSLATLGDRTTDR